MRFWSDFPADDFILPEWTLTALSFSGSCFKWKVRTSMLEQQKLLSWVIASSVYLRNNLSFQVQNFSPHQQRVGVRLPGERRPAKPNAPRPPPPKLFCDFSLFLQRHAICVQTVQRDSLLGCWSYVSRFCECWSPLGAPKSTFLIQHVWKIHWSCYLSRDRESFLCFTSIHAWIPTPTSENYSLWCFRPCVLLPFLLKTTLSAIYFLRIEKMSLHWLSVYTKDRVTYGRGCNFASGTLL